MGNSQMQLFMRINPSSVLVYEYLAIDPVGFRVIGFGESFVDLSLFKDREMNLVASDYVATSRILDVELDSMDDLIASCIRNEPYDLVAWMDGSGKCVITFKGNADGTLDEVEMYSNSPIKMDALVSTVVIAELHRLREEAYAIEE